SAVDLDRLFQEPEALDATAAVDDDRGWRVVLLQHLDGPLALLRWVFTRTRVQVDVEHKDILDVLLLGLLRERPCAAVDVPVDVALAVELVEPLEQLVL